MKRNKNNSHNANMNHLIICALVDTFSNKNIAPCHINHRLGKQAENTIKGILNQHWDEYKRTQKG